MCFSALLPGGIGATGRPHPEVPQVRQRNDAHALLDCAHRLQHIVGVSQSGQALLLPLSASVGLL